MGPRYRGGIFAALPSSSASLVYLAVFEPSTF